MKHGATLRRVAWSSLASLLSACGGSAPPTTEQVMRARWAQARASVAPVRAAIEACAKANGDTVGRPCDSVADLIISGFLPADYRIPADTSLDIRWDYSASMFNFVSGPVGGNCKLSIYAAINPGDHRVVWQSATVSGAGCYSSVVGDNL
jgi:hypothetical protein